MDTLTPNLTHEAVAQFWRRRFLRQKHVNVGVRSLLRKYGAAHDTVSVARDLLHTLMGNLITADACFYATSEDGRTVKPVQSCGRVALTDLSPFSVKDPFVSAMVENGRPGLLNSLPRTVGDGENVAPITQNFRLYAPLRFDDGLEGFVFLGSRVAGSNYTDNDMELLEALCAVTGAILAYVNRHRAAAVSVDQSHQVIVRCQELAGGIADHLERVIAGIQAFVADETRHNPQEIARQLTRSTESISYMLSPLRLIQRNPFVLESSPQDHYDAVEAVHEAIFTFDRNVRERRHSLSITSDVRPGTPALDVDRKTIVAGIRNTLTAALEAHAGPCEIAVTIDECDGLPRRIGSSNRDEPQRRVLRLRIAATSGNAPKPGDSAQSMKMLADNLEAFQAARDTSPAQTAIVDAGGAILHRSESFDDTWLVYVPLRRS